MKNFCHICTEYESAHFIHANYLRLKMEALKRTGQAKYINNELYINQDGMLSLIMNSPLPIDKRREFLRNVFELDYEDLIRTKRLN